MCRDVNKVGELFMLKIISGGQTGSDIAGLRAAKKCGLTTGGIIARGFETEDGFFPAYENMYGLVDKGFDYRKRTSENVRMADITLIFADKLKSPGTRLTISCCASHDKPYLLNPKKEEIIDWVRCNNPKVINVAGNRESVSPGITARTEKLLIDAFREI